MNDRSVRIAICIKDRVARQLACSMFSSAGAEIQLCDDTSAIKAAADAQDLQAIVLGLGVAPEPTFDALVLLRQWFANIPIYVIADAAGQRHGKRTKAFGATQVVPHEELQRRVGQLVRAASQGAKKDDLDVRAPGWAPGKGDDGYEVQSMDLGAWLSVPGNRQLLGIKDPPGSSSSSTPVSQEPVFGTPPAAPATPAAPARVATISASDWTSASVVLADSEPADVRPVRSAPSAAGVPSARAAPAPPFAPPAPPFAPTAPPAATPVPVPPVPVPPASVPPAPLPSVPAPAAAPVEPCGLTDCSRLAIFRVEHDAQLAAILEAQKQREKRALEQNQTQRERLQAELRAELAEGLAAAETRLQVAFDERLRLDIEGTISRLKRMVALLAFVLVLLVAGLVWRLGPWWTGWPW